jgi:hypothetical protein
MAPDQPGDRNQHKARVHPLWRLATLLCILFAVVSSAMYAATAILEPSTYGGVASASLGAILTRTTDDGRIDVIAHGVKPDGPLARAGVREGDRLRLDIRWNDFRTLGTGETFGFTRVAPGSPQHMQLIVPEFNGHTKNVANYRFLITLFDLGLGLLLFFRSRGDTGVEALAMAFVAATITSNFPSPPLVAVLWLTSAYAGAALVPFLTLAFALSFYGRNIRPVPRAAKFLFWILNAVFAANFVVGAFSSYFAYSGPLIRINLMFLFVEELLAYGATVYYFAMGFRLASGDLKKRFAFLLIALALTFCLTLVQTFSFLILKQAKLNPDNPLYDVNLVLSLVGPLLFTYAVLRHRVVDIGFVLNRTLVYGVVSLILLTAFGLVEWAADHFLKPASHNESAALDAVIAVGIFLTFHRVRDFVEHYLEILFFHRWHENERRLEQFVSESGFISRADSLISAFVAELRRFTGGAAVGLYLGDDQSNYRSVANDGSAPATIDTDDPALVAMRAQRRNVDPTERGSHLPAILALPILHRNGLLGFVLLGPKPGEDRYRPDEIRILGEATRQIGLDLHALKVEQLERDTAALTQNLRELQLENALLRKTGAASTA